MHRDIQRLQKLIRHNKLIDLDLSNTLEYKGDQSKFSADGHLYCLECGSKMFWQGIRDWKYETLQECHNCHKIYNADALTIIIVREKIRTVQIELGKCDTPSSKGISYPRDVMEKAIDKARKIYGFISTDIYLSAGTTSHWVKDLFIDEDGFIRGTLIAFNDSKGDLVLELLNNKVAKCTLHGEAMFGRNRDLNTISEFTIKTAPLIVMPAKEVK